jgi:hypothetical protein
VEQDNEPRQGHHQLAVHTQEGTPEVRLQQKQHHTVRELVAHTAVWAMVQVEDGPADAVERVHTLTALQLGGHG